MKFETAALVKLKVWAEKNDLLRPSAFAARFGINQSLASRWLSGASRPNNAHSNRLAEETGIPARDWMTGPELERETREQQAANRARAS